MSRILTGASQQPTKKALTIDYMETHYWHRMEEQRMYFTNLFDIKGLPNHISSRLFLTLFYYGKAVLVQLNGKWLVCLSNDTNSVDIEGKWAGGVVSLAPMNLSQIRGQQFYKPFKAPANKSVLFKWNDLGISPAITLREYVAKIVLLEVSALTSSLTSTKTHQMAIQNNTTMAEQQYINNWLNPNTNVVFNTSVNVGVEGATGTLNNGGSRVKEIKSNEPTTIHFENLNTYTRLVYQRIGRRINTNDKKERVIVSEQQASDTSFPILEREIIRNLRESITDYNTKFNGDLELYAYVPNDTDENVADDKGQPVDDKGGE